MKKKELNAIHIALICSAVFLLSLVIFIALSYKEMFQSRPTVSYYYLPSCGWCTKFNPEWEKFIKDAPPTIMTEKVDGSSSPDIEKYNIKAFPHIQLVKGDTVMIFEGDRTSENLMKFVRDNA